MCWSKFEREQLERERREAELEAERIRFAAETQKDPASEPAVQLGEREKELVRG
jgi:hypothetical protein